MRVGVNCQLDRTYSRLGDMLLDMSEGDYLDCIH